MSIYNTAVNKPISTLMVFLAIIVLGVACLYTITGGPVSQDGPALYHGNGNLSGS